MLKIQAEWEYNPEKQTFMKELKAAGVWIRNMLSATINDDRTMENYDRSDIAVHLTG